MSRSRTTRRALLAGAATPSRPADWVIAFILANGGNMLSRDQSKVRFAEAPAVEVFEMWADMTHKGEAYAGEGFNHQAILVRASSPASTTPA